MGSETDLPVLLDATAGSVREMTGRLKYIQTEVQGLGFIARTFVEKDFSSSTGRGLADWARAAEALAVALEAARDNPQARPRAAQTIGAERPRLATLRAYLERAPQKVTMIPGGMLKPAQRADFLREVADQVRAVQEIERQLALLAESLASVA